MTCSGGAGGTRLWKDYAALVDIFRIDPYPVIAGVPLVRLVERIQLARQAAGEGKPVWVVLQAWTFGPDSPFPSGKQDRCMAYLALVSGARGLSRFDFNLDVWARHPDFWNSLLLTNREIRLLAPILLSGERCEIKTKPFTVRVGAWKTKKGLLAVAVNPDAAKASVRFELPARLKEKSKAVFLFPNRHSRAAAAPPKIVTNESGLDLSLDLEPYGVRVLWIPLSRFARLPVDYPLEDADVRGPGVVVIDRARNWIRIKNVVEEPTTASVHWKSRRANLRELDIAFRPVRQVSFAWSGKRLLFVMKPQTAYEIGKRPAAKDLLGDGREFRRLGLNITINSQYPAERGFSAPAQRYRAFEGAALPVSVKWTSAREIRLESVKIEIVEPNWERRLLGHVHSKPPRSKWGIYNYEIHVPKPKRHDRDEVITLRISRDKRHILRRMRFRVEQPFESEFKWNAPQGTVLNGSGVFDLRSRFAGYPFKKVRVRPVDVPEGWSQSVEGEKRFRVQVSPPAVGTGEKQVHAFHLEATADGVPPKRFSLPRLLLTNGRLLTAPSGPRRIRIRAATSPIVLDGRIDEKAWEQGAHLIGFLGVGTAEFAERQPRAWLTRDEKHLYLAARLPIRGSLRVREAERDRLEFSDDLFELYLESDAQPGFACLFVNAKGTIADFTIRPRSQGEAYEDLGWNSGAIAESEINNGAWSVELRLPFKSFSKTLPGPGTKWRFNIRTPHGIAPRSAEVFSFTSDWQPRPDEFSVMEFVGR